ncbi:hypothetical protein GOARA_019_00320 [Gordonia araii NBRC 100433]|uniref:Uncharacterized protein n=1 Tax=Gordonia araii NBRC 100433 TaxID=1073574 RepID=G7GYS5_9ACTN|nr:hypothetical protein [Gordonia araii]NNG98949.1 hypothetical protein [Gordonia araii NBRC 100433]GAB08750.1 hypothetical protein GOARA_019_00320 [Gordonia araii NBRC 100433]
MSYRDPRDQFPGTRAYTQANQQPGHPGQGQAQPQYAESGQWDQPDQRPRAPRVPAPTLNPLLFAGGVVMTGVVVALAVWLVAWIMRTVANRVNETQTLGVWNPLEQSELWFALVGFLCALLAAGLWYVLQVVTPAPASFFRWIVGLLVVAAVLVPILLATSDLVAGICTALVHLVIGLPILALIPMVGRQSMQR